MHGMLKTGGNRKTRFLAFLAFLVFLRKPHYFSIFTNNTGTIACAASVAYFRGGKELAAAEGGRGAGPGDCSHPGERVHLPPDGYRVTKAL